MHVYITVYLRVYVDSTVYFQHTNIRTSIYVGMYTSLYTYEHEHSYVYAYTRILHYILTSTHTHVYCTIQYCYVCIQHCVLTIKHTHTFIHMHVFTVPYTCICMDACNAVYVNLDRGGKDGAR